MTPAVRSLLLIALLATVAHAQETTGNLTGRLLDPEGTPVASVTVTVTGPTLPGEREIQTTPDGRFRFLALPVGTCSVTVSHADFQVVILEEVVIRLGRTTELGDLQLADRDHEREEVIVVGRTSLRVRSGRARDARRGDADPLVSSRSHPAETGEGPDLVSCPFSSASPGPTLCRTAPTGVILPDSATTRPSSS